MLSGIMLKMGLYSVIRWQLPIAAVAAKTYYNTFRPWYCWGNLRVYSRLKTKDLKKLLAYSSLAHVGLIAAGTYTLTLDGLRGAVLQMIAHGFVVVGLFLLQTLFTEDMKQELSMKWEVFVHKHLNLLRCFNTGIGLSCITNYF
jgi:NADH-quinone oxidoreductase subunit M